MNYFILISRMFKANAKITRLIFCIMIVVFSASLQGQGQNNNLTKKAEIKDRYHYSSVFSGQRNYRMFLPAGYSENTSKRYPVFYYFHGWAQRHFGSWGSGYANYDRGDENDGDNIEKFVSENEVIVVKIDGLNMFSTEAITLGPYNVSTVTTFRQFPIYFEELIHYIDGHYRTVPDREHRATSGLSMGGFMCFWLAAKYPDLVCAAGNFCGSTEFSAGPIEFPVEYAHADMFDNFKGVSLRMNNGTRDRLRFYHQDMNRVLLNVLPQYEFKVYEASHITCGLGDMFDFIMKAFESPLPLPDQWDYIDIYPFFEVWDYKVETDRNRAGFTVLENVNPNGFKIAVRNFLPDGELMPNVSARIMTSPIYKKNHDYHITDVDLRSFVKKNYLVRSDSEGRLSVDTNGSLHDIGISEGAGSPNLSMAKYSIDNMEWAETGNEVALSIEILNKGVSNASGITGEIVALSDSLEVLEGMGKLQALSSLSIDRLKGNFKVKNNKLGVEIAKFKLILKDEAGHEWAEEFELQFKDPVCEITDFVIADGREMTVVNAAVDSVTGIVGAGNGDGVANPGETIVILVKEGGKYIRTNAYTLNPQINAQHTNIRVSDKWQDYDHIGGSVKYTKPVVFSGKAKKKDIWFYVEYWLPANHIISGKHIIKKGKIKIEVKGKDETPPQIQWLQVVTNDRVEARVYDVSGIDKVALTFVPNEEASTIKHVGWDKVPTAFEVELVDSGLDGDAVKGDGVYSRKIENQPSYFYNIEAKTIDSEGNNEVFNWPEAFLLKNTEYSK
jgi:S-formylglutathione hydrolase FrmB